MASARAATALLRDGALEVIRPGSPRLDGPTLVRFGRVVLALVITTTNLIGAFVVLVLANFVLPLPHVGGAAHIRHVNTWLAVGYLVIALPLGTALGMRGMLRLRRWLAEDRRPDYEETRAVLRAPLSLSALQLGLWLVAMVLFAVVNASFSGALALRVGVLIVFGGLVTATCAYLLTELLLRPAAARAMAHGVPGRLAGPGVATRAVLAWAFGTGVPVLGVVFIGILGLTGDRTADHQRLAIAMVVLGGIGIVVGLLAVAVAARATADPVESVRRALAEVQRGSFDVRVPVYDSTQIGQLQLGFNEMVSGLAERDRIREAFGTYVDPDVAEHILEEGTRLSGEEVEVTIMFVDVRGFTPFAERTAAEEVVSAINHLFEQIVPVVHDHGGRVDKFVGDGLLAVFGAPRRQDDHADQALAAALQIASSVDSPQGLEIGIGLNSGKVVAGNVGGAGRLEFSVIGDAVNVAARVEAATRETGDRILLTERTRELLSRAPELEERSGVELKGKSERVGVYAPRAGG